LLHKTIRKNLGEEKEKRGESIQEDQGGGVSRSEEMLAPRLNNFNRGSGPEGKWKKNQE